MRGVAVEGVAALDLGPEFLDTSLSVLARRLRRRGGDLEIGTAPGGGGVCEGDLAGPPDTHLRPYLDRPEPLWLRTGLRQPHSAAHAAGDGAGTGQPRPDRRLRPRQQEHLGRVRRPGPRLHHRPHASARTDAPATFGRTADLQLASRFAFANRAFFCEPELERVLAR